MTLPTSPHLVPAPGRPPAGVTPREPPDLPAWKDFLAAATGVVEQMHRQWGQDLWMVTRREGDLLCLLEQSQGLMMELPGGGLRCVSEEFGEGKALSFNESVETHGLLSTHNSLVLLQATQHT